MPPLTDTPEAATAPHAEPTPNLNPFGECPLPIFDHPQIVLGHGSGGKLSAELISKVFAARFANPILNCMDDQAQLDLGSSRIAFTTDSFVVTPIFFPGGDIGTLAVNGTVNDLAVGGARPLFLSAAFILEEGLPTADLTRIVDSMRAAADTAGVQIVTGDTKVVNRGKGDKIFITTTGVGVLDRDITLSADRCRPGDQVILSGYIGDHGITILSQRENLEFESDLRSDCAPLHTLTAAMLDAAEAAGDPSAIRCMRDPTRGGVASTLNEIAQRSACGMLLDEAAIPVRDNVRGACEVLGLDPLYVANEGKLLAILSPDAAGAVFAAMSAHPLARDARLIGEVTSTHPGMVLMKTSVGGTRVVDLLFGEQLPRIC